MFSASNVPVNREKLAVPVRAVMTLSKESKNVPVELSSFAEFPAAEEPTFPIEI